MTSKNKTNSENHLKDWGNQCFYSVLLTLAGNICQTCPLLRSGINKNCTVEPDFFQCEYSYTFNDVIIPL